MTPAEAFALLGLPEDAAPDAVRSAYRLAAKAAHPDAGGSPEAFGRLTEALAVALAAATAERVCRACSGMGSFEASKGFYRVRLRCAECAGTGRAVP